jgi:hypothetical protein
LHEPRYGLAVLIGVAVGAPGVAYLTELHHLIVSKTPTTIAVIAVVVFETITFALVIVPFAFYLVHPQSTDAAIRRFKDWVFSHERQIAATVALLAGGYMVISGTLRVVN